MLENMLNFFRSGADMLLIDENGMSFLVEVNVKLRAEGYDYTAIGQYLSWLKADNKADTEEYPEGEGVYLPIEREEIINELGLFEALIAA